MSVNTAMRCFCECKDTNFLANHNDDKENAENAAVVSASAKILIF